MIKEGIYRNPVVTPDGRWVVAAKIKNYDEPGDVVRVNLQTGRETKINLPSADIFHPTAFVYSQNKILLYRAMDGSSRSKNDPRSPAPEYYLLDADTGAAKAVKGEFRPLEEQTFRGLQPTGNAGEFWAAIYNEEKKLTEIGRYSDQTFTFKPVIQLPEIRLDSMDIWIDEAESKAYFVYQGHLLAVPLKKAVN